MNGQIVSEDNINTSPPTWQHPVLPGNAIQGSLLFTVNNFINPPEDMSNFKWLPMEDIIGTADVKLEYDETTSIYSIYKAKGHLDNNNQWQYDWQLVGTIAGITPDVKEALEALVYYSYEYDTSISNTLKVYGIKKDGTRVLLCDINFASQQELTTAINTLTNALNAETTRATNKENELEAAITAENTALQAEITRATNKENEIKPINGIATNITQGSSVVGREVNVEVDGTSIVVDNANKLKSNVIDDTATGLDKTFSAQKITAMLRTAMKYIGDLATMAELQAITGQDTGWIYYVVETGNYYIWNGTIWRDMEADYTAGVGIDITNRVISASGVAFATGDGLQVQGSGTQAVMSVKAGTGLGFAADKSVNVIASDGLSFDANNKIKVNAGAGLEVDNQNIIKVKGGNGIIIDNNGVHLNGNFGADPSNLGNNLSGITIFADGKIAVDPSSFSFGTGTLLYSQTNMPTNVPVSCPNLNQYAYVAVEIWGIDSVGNYSMLSRTFFQNTENRWLMSIPHQKGQKLCYGNLNWASNWISYNSYFSMTGDPIDTDLDFKFYGVNLEWKR